jgi:hypothetical protein
MPSLGEQELVTEYRRMRVFYWRHGRFFGIGCTQLVTLGRG